MVEMTMHRVGLCTQDGTPVIVLRERLGPRFLSVKVSSLHANAVMRHFHRLPPYRPQTHEAFLAIVQAIGASIAAAHLTAFDEHGFAAHVTFTRGTHTADLAATAADAIVLAVRAGATIFVAPVVMDRFAQPEPEGPVDCTLLPRADSSMASAAIDADTIQRFIDSLTKLDDLGR